MAVLRAQAKAVNFSVIYGATGKGPAETAWKNPNCNDGRVDDLLYRRFR